MKQRFSERWMNRLGSIESLFFMPIFLVWLFLFFGLVIALSVTYVSHLQDEQQRQMKVITDLFQQNVSNEMKSGTYLTIRKRCTQFFSNEFVLKLSIVGGSEMTVCEFNRKGGPLSFPTTWNREVYYGDSGPDIVGTIELIYDNSSLYKHYLKFIASLLIISIISIFATAWLIRRVSRFVTAPIQNVVRALSTEDFKSLHSVRESLGQTHVKELNSLYEGLEKLGAALKSYENRLTDDVRNRSFAELAAQVSHDIKSPVMALSVAIRELPPEQSEAHQLIQLSLVRIQEIADRLLSRSRQLLFSQTEANGKIEKVISLSPVLRDLVREKEAEYHQRAHFTLLFSGDLLDSYIVKIDDVEFKRAISNLLNNSVEAVQNQMAQIELTVFSFESHILLKIKDNGKGMSAAVLSQIGQRGFTSGKGLQGSGLGVWHAIQTVQAAQGRLEISSAEGLGTVVSITLPKMNRLDS